MTGQVGHIGRTTDYPDWRRHFGSSLGARRVRPGRARTKVLAFSFSPTLHSLSGKRGQRVVWQKCRRARAGGILVTVPPRVKRERATRGSAKENRACRMRYVLSISLPLSLCLFCARGAWRETKGKASSGRHRDFDAEQGRERGLESLRVPPADARTWGGLGWTGGRAAS